MHANRSSVYGHPNWDAALIRRAQAVLSRARALFLFRPSSGVLLVAHSGSRRDRKCNQYTTQTSSLIVVALCLRLYARVNDAVPQRNCVGCVGEKEAMNTARKSYMSAACAHAGAMLWPVIDS